MDTGLWLTAVKHFMASHKTKMEVKRFAIATNSRISTDAHLEPNANLHRGIYVVSAGALCMGAHGDKHCKQNAKPDNKGTATHHGGGH